MLLVAMTVPFLVTALAGWTGAHFESRRARMLGVFGFGSLVYTAMIGFTVTVCTFQSEDVRGLLLSSIPVWITPMASSGLAVLLLWGSPPPRSYPTLVFNAASTVRLFPVEGMRAYRANQFLCCRYSWPRRVRGGWPTRITSGDTDL